MNSTPSNGEYVSVPCEPTIERLVAGIHAYQHCRIINDPFADWAAFYRAALASAPRPDADAKLAEIRVDEAELNALEDMLASYEATTPDSSEEIRQTRQFQTALLANAKWLVPAVRKAILITERAASLERDYAQLDALMKQVSKENQEGHETILALEKTASEASKECERLRAIEAAARVVDEEFDPDDSNERPVATALLELRRVLGAAK